ncbi:DUF3667 domain-containing protein [Sphingomonas sp. BN140010]|uniref:DUF3667 domain-containing protein n=1 Tax=Sphingomonas arvum TaxID=2992113 RepID=A0ABT3JC66_9SPHN|nr:DUF3667 domain-containing protein [Sphingomonas sp. BN140010]MCW3796391.1 DUF3667 domain-containing protein [Sphingomonas sp. BN140010]
MNREGSVTTAASTTTCLNCGAALGGSYCASCGQKALIPRSLAGFAGDLVAGLFNFEGKFWATLPMLAWRPGELTRRYVEGQRSRFISPVALYLFSVFLMFAALSFSGTLSNVKITGDLDSAAREELVALQRLEQDRASTVSQGKPTAELDRKIASQREELKQLQQLKEGRLPTGLSEDGNNPPWLRNALRKVATEPNAVMANVQEATSKYSWALIPLSVPFMWLLFPFRRNVHLFDHAVFVTYSLSFMMLLILAGSLLVMAGAGSFAALLLLVPPVHLYRQLKGAYRLRWWSALIRTFVLLIVASVVLALFGTAMLALGVFS